MRASLVAAVGVLVSFAASASARQITLTSPPKRITSISGHPIGMIDVVAASRDGRVLLVGGGPNAYAELTD